MLKTKKCIVIGKTAPIDPTQVTLVWFGSDLILNVNRTKANRMSFYLAVRMIFRLKTELNRTVNTPNIKTLSNPPPIQFFSCIKWGGFYILKKNETHFSPNVLYFFHSFFPFLHTFYSLPFQTHKQNFIEVNLLF